jgi:hypothetical protein
VALVMGLGNGMGSGLVMTLGSDASPAVGRPVFLGAWRLVSTVGAAAGPLTVSVVAAVASLALASAAVAALGAVGALALRLWTPAHQSHPPPS